jgi:exodeoxyribonuclease VII small subunit
VTELKYSKAVKKLDEILAKLETEQIDVDELADNVKEAVNLLKVCKNKIEKAQLEVKKVVDGFTTEDADDDQ